MTVILIAALALAVIACAFGGLLRLMADRYDERIARIRMGEIEQALCRLEGHDDRD